MSLSATVTAGKRFTSSELVDNAKLNQMAVPSVILSGSADTSQISEDSVTAAKLAFGAAYYCTDSGTANAHVIDLGGHALASYVDGLVLRYEVNAGNDTTTTHSLAVGALVSAGTSATVTTPIAHGLAIGDTVMVYGAAQDEYNGTFQVASVTATQFTYVFAGSTTTPATGSIAVRYSAVGGVSPYVQTAGVTVNVAALGVKNLFGPGGARLLPGEIITGSELQIVYQATAGWFEIQSRQNASEVIRAVDNSTTPNAYTAQSIHGRSDLVTSTTLLVCRMAASNTGSATLAFNGRSGTIRKNGLTALVSNDILAGQWCVFLWDGTYWQILSPTPAITRTTVPVRQCILSCSVDGTTALPNFLTGIGSTFVNFQNCASPGEPLVLAFAYGQDANGAVDFVATINANTSNVWTGLSAANTTYYLYADRNISTGAITYGQTTTRPIYTNAIGIGNNTYIITTGKMVNGTSTAIQRLFVGEAATGGGGSPTLTSVTPYMPRGEFRSGTDQSFALDNSSKSENHQLGLTPRQMRWVMVDQSGGDGHTQYDEVALPMAHGPSGVFLDIFANATTCTVRYMFSTYPPYVLNASSALDSVDPTQWKLRCYASRGW